MAPWEFERDGEVVRVDPAGPLLVSVGTATDLAVDAALAGSGIVYLFEDWLRPHLDSGALEPILESWWQRFSGPFLYYPGRRLVPPPLRAFIDFIKAPPAPRALKSEALALSPAPSRDAAAPAQPPVQSGIGSTRMRPSVPLPSRARPRQTP